MKTTKKLNDGKIKLTKSNIDDGYILFNNKMPRIFWVISEIPLRWDKISVKFF